jgi:hypothetical protein
LEWRPRPTLGCSAIEEEEEEEVWIRVLFMRVHIFSGITCLSTSAKLSYLLENLHDTHTYYRI